MHLFNIPSNIRLSLEAYYVDEDGVIHGEAQLIETCKASTECILGALSYVKELEADEETLKNREAEISARRAVLKRRAESIRKYALAGMKALGEKKVSNAEITAFIKGSTSVEIPDLEKLDANFKTAETVYKADKKAIAKAIKSGKTVAGASLKEGESITIKT